MKSTASSEGCKPAVARTDFDPAYTFNDGDLVLRSVDGTNFRVHSIILKLGSSVFRDMLDIPTGAPNTAERTKRELAKGPIIASEPASVLRILLDILYPGARHVFNVDVIDSPDLLNSLVLAARKYDMVSVIEGICAFIVTRDAISHFHPVKLYGIAWNLGCAFEAIFLSAETLRYNLNTPEVFTFLKETNTKGVVKLQILHRRRKVLLLNALHEMSGEPPYASDVCDVVVPDHSSNTKVNFAASYCTDPSTFYDALSKSRLAWMTLKYEISKSMDEQSDGSPLTEFGGEFYAKSRFADIEHLVGLDVLSKEIARLLDMLPRHIEI